jgi:hypothetical protein
MDKLPGSTWAVSHHTTPIHARETPESGIVRSGVPKGTHAKCQLGKFLHKMQPFSGMLKKRNITIIAIACY